MPKNSKKVQFLAPEKAKILPFKAPFNSKKALGAWKLQKGAFCGARKSQNGFPKNSKQVYYRGPENAKMCYFKAPFNSKKASQISGTY